MFQSRFLSTLCSRKENCEIGTTYTFDNLKAFATKKYTNLVKENVWGEVDPKNAKIMALATQIQTMSNLLDISKSAHLTNNQSNSGRQNKINIASWRKFKTSALVKRDNKKWYWCPKHTCKGDYDRIYVTHPAPEHDKCVEKLNNWGNKKEEK